MLIFGDKTWNALLYTFILFPALLFSQMTGKLESLRLYEKDLVILGEDRRGPYLLPDSLIIENSEKVFLNNQPLAKEKYQFNCINGEVRFIEPVPKGAEIRLIYKIFPYSLQKSYLHRTIQQRVFGAPTAPVDPRAQETQPESEDYASQLTKSGSITRGVTVGSNRGLKVNSALNINVSGKVADNVEVVAALTDQSTPIQPEGTTQNLQEIDKVFIQIKSPDLAATMGDFHIQYDQTQFAQYNRKLQGAMGEAEYDRIQARVSAAISRGKYNSMQFNGQEGSQGPYQLKGDRGQSYIIVLAGTERVFIDGELMIRGETNDYIIDYAAAQITFTRRRLITSDSRITVDFQYSDEQYRRNLYSAAVNTNLWDKRIRLGAIYLHESDDKNNPLDFALTDDYRRILEQAGDNQLDAVIDGATYVGPGKGRYNRLDSIYVYAGEKLGDYNVAFSEVGGNLGSYQYSGSGAYKFVGEGNGSYAPVVILPLPKSHDVLDFALHFSPLSSINLYSEYAISNFDKNAFSTLDKEDDIGLAQNWTLDVRPNTIKMLGKNVGKLTFTGKYKKVDNTFSDIDRTNEIEYNRRWDVPESMSREEIVKEVRSTYEPFNGFGFGAEYGTISKGNYFFSDRWQAESHFKVNKLPAYRYRLEQIKSNYREKNQLADWQRQRGDIEWTIWKLKPFFEYEGEVKKENWADTTFTGFKFDDVGAGLEIRPFEKLLISGRTRQRDDKQYVGYNKFSDKSFANTQNVQIQLQRVREITASLDLTHRVKSYAQSEQDDTRTDLAELRLQLTPWQRALSADWNYRISNTATAKKERLYIKVPEGEGNYRFDEDLNEYVYDPLGDHVLRILTTDQFIPTIELKTSTRLRLEPKRFFSQSSSKEDSRSFFEQTMSALSSETYVAIEERTQTDKTMDVYLLRLSSFRQPGNTILGYLQFRQDLYLFERSRDFSLRYRYRTRDELNNQFLEGGEERLERENAVRMTNRLSRLFSSQSELTQKRTARFFNYAGKQNRDIHATQFNADLSYTPSSVLKVALEGRLSWEQDVVYENPTRVQSYALTPRVTYSFRNRGRLSGEFEWSYVDANPRDRVLPYEMANGRSIGQSSRWDIRFDYRISSVIQATLSYSGRSEPERDRVIHTGRAQVTAAFR
ncbi:hypothetical protein JXA70_06290 [candidate division KSB1 bacterium]|nr:hypothetical protein [candidate division KSB1 bacterium]